MTRSLERHAMSEVFSLNQQIRLHIRPMVRERMKRSLLLAVDERAFWLTAYRIEREATTIFRGVA